jgi:flagellar basal-body rod protein FlgG
MFQPLYVAATGLSALQDEMLDITNNVSNAQTVGFKKERTQMESLFYVEKSFKDILYQEMSGSETPPVNVEYGTGVRIASTPKDFSQGTIDVTNNTLDLAISGNGFFQVKLADGTAAYSRAGNFHADNEGNLVDANGHMLDPQIIFPDGTTAITIQQDGTVLAATNNGSLSTIGQISLVRFPNPGGLKSIGQNLYQSNDASGQPVIGVATQEGFGSINQYSLEQSNVDVISEMMRLVMVQRVFDTVTKAVASYQTMLTSLNQMKQ